MQRDDLTCSLKRWPKCKGTNYLFIEKLAATDSSSNRQQPTTTDNNRQRPTATDSNPQQQAADKQRTHSGQSASDQSILIHALSVPTLDQVYRRGALTYVEKHTRISLYLYVSLYISLCLSKCLSISLYNREKHGQNT